MLGWVLEDYRLFHSITIISDDGFFQTSLKSVQAELVKATQLQEQLKAEAENAKKEMQASLQEVCPSAWRFMIGEHVSVCPSQYTCIN